MKHNSELKLLDKIPSIILTPILAILIPPFLIISSPIFLYRWIIKSVAKYIRPDLIKMTTPLTNHYAQTDSLDNPHSTTILTVIIQGQVEHEQVLNTFEEKVLFLKDPKKSEALCYPEFQQYYTTWCGFKFWKQDLNFKIQNHIKLFKKRTEDGVMRDEDLRKFIEIQIRKAYISTQSPWEITVIQNLKLNSEKDTCTCILFRYHHSLADAYSFLGVLQSLGDNPNLLNIKPRASLKTKKSILHQILFPIKLLHSLSKILLMGLKSESFKVQLAKKSNRMHFDVSKPILVKKLLEIKTAKKTVVTSVIHAAVTGAIRKLILSKNTKVTESVDWMLPVPMPGHPGGLSNHFTFAPLTLPIGEKDGFTRLRICHENFDSLRTSVVPIVGGILSQLCGSYLNSIGSRVTSVFYSGVVTYFPITVQSFNVFGKKIVQWYSLTGLLASSSGICVSVNGFADKLYATVVADDAVLSKEDCRYFLDRIIDEIDDLVQST